MKLLNIPNSDSELHNLMRSSGQKMIYTVGGLYFVGHIITTLVYPQIFIPRIWGISLYMFTLAVLSLLIIQHKYVLSQAFWLCGLSGGIVLAFFVFKQTEITLLLMAIPFMAVVSLGIPGAVTAILLVIATIDIMILSIAGVPTAYAGIILFGSVSLAVFGWSISSNLFDALQAASFHYSEARRLLAETQNRQAEITRILKDRNQVNYQLERMNEMLNFARNQAEEARESRNRFMLAVSHELRSPLNFIIGFSDLMVNAPETYAPLSRWPSGLFDDVHEIYTSSKHLMRLINDILDMGKIDARQMSLYREKAKIDQIVDDVREMLRDAFEKKNISLAIEVPPDLPFVFIDTTRIRQVFLNLLNNGLRFTDRGAVSLKIQKMEEHLLVSVTDTGMGIAPEDLPRVFEEFRQVGEENWRRHAGTGLGLYISRQFVELHGGEMGVESTLGKGTRFFFTLPLASTVTDVPINLDMNRPSKDNPLILMISPYPEDVDLLRHSLDGYILELVPDVDQAKARTRELFPRAILVASDAGILIPDELPYALPVVKFGLSRAITPKENLHAYLVKPISRKSLIEAILSLGPDVHNILILDDDPAMIRFVRQSFRADSNADTLDGYNLLSAVSGIEGNEVIQKNVIDAILLDLELPDIHGWDWLTQLRSRPEMADIPVIIISAEDRQTQNFVPGTSVLELALQRPLGINELGNVLKAVLENVLPQYPKEKQMA